MIDDSVIIPVLFINGKNTCTSCYIVSYIGFMQVIRADMTCLGFIFTELKTRGNI